MKQWILFLAIPLIVIQLSGCQANENKWVVSNNVENVKPRQGIGYQIKNFVGYQGFEWIDEDSMMVYKQSDTVFGVDRGLAVFNATEGQVINYIQTQKKPRRVIYEPDGKGMVYSIASEGTSYGYVVYQDIKTGKEKRYPYDAWTFETQKPWQKGRDLFLPDVENEMNVWRMNQDGIVKRLALPLPPGFKKSDTLFIYGCFESSTKIYAVVAGYEFNELLVYDKENKVSRFHEQKKVIDAGINPMGEAFYLVQRGQEYSDETLSIIDEKNQMIPLVSHKNIGMAEWSPKGRYLMYTIESLQNETEVYMVDLINQSTHFIKGYHNERVESIKMSPDEKKIMVRLGPNPVLQTMIIE